MTTLPKQIMTTKLTAAKILKTTNYNDKDVGDNNDDKLRAVRAKI